MFEGKDLGQLTSFCGCEIVRHDGGLKVRLRRYIQGLLDLFKIEPLPSSTSASLPSVPTISECPETPDPAVKKAYLQLTGMLIWIFSRCRFDLAFPMHCIARVMHCPAPSHLKCVRHLCRYLASTINWDLSFHRVPEFARNLQKRPCDLWISPSSVFVMLLMPTIQLP